MHSTSLSERSVRPKLYIEVKNISHGQPDGRGVDTWGWADCGAERRSGPRSSVGDVDGGIRRMPCAARNTSSKKGKTRVLAADEARVLLNSINVSTAVGLRDRALIALIAYTFARVSTATAMRVEDYFVQGRRGWGGFTRRAASITRCRRTIILINIWSFI